MSVLRSSPHDREILRLAVPALGALAAEPLYLLADTAVVGHLGTPELGGLAVAGTVLTTAFFLFNFLAYGTTASVSRLVGGGDEAAAARQAAQSGWLALGLGLLLTALGVAFAPQAVDLFGADAVVRVHAVTYLRVSALGAPAVLLALAAVGYLRGLQDTRTTLLVAVGSNVLNLVLELALIYGLGMGMAASAAATVTAQVAAAAAYLTVVGRQVARTGAPLRPDLRRLLGLARVGRDLFVRTGSLLAALAVATAVASRMGTAPLGAHQIAFQLWSFLALVLDAIAIAGQAIVGRMLGASRSDEARAASGRMIQWGVVAGLLFAAGVVLLRPALIPIFTDDPAVRDEAMAVLLVVAVLQPLNAIVFVLDGVLIGAGDMRYLARAMVVSGLLVFVPAAVAVSRFGLGLMALWGALALLMASRLIGVGARYRSGRWAVTGMVVTR
jgi:putative MATE family efflux protein